jgi:CelD/BcsL family acetyltransferase involved in cellulose biosynthesis
MIDIEIIDTFDKFLRLESVWDELLSKSDMDVPFMTFEWFFCWWKSFGEGNRLLIILAKKEGKIIGIMPFMLSKTRYRGLPVRAISFIANDHSHRISFILTEYKKEVVFSILKYLLNSKYKFEIFNPEHMLAGSDTDNFLKEVLSKHNFIYRKIENNLAPYILINGSWDNFTENLSKNFKKKLRHTDNLFRRAGTFEIERYATDNIQKGLDELLLVSKKSWKYTRRTAIANNEKEKRFYRLLADISAAKGWLNLWILKLNRKPIAFQFNLIYKQKYYSLKVSYDKEYGFLSPGFFLDKFVIEDCFRQNVKECDFLGKNDVYKQQWASMVRGHCTYYVFGNSIYAKIIALIETKLIAKMKKIALLRKIFTIYQRCYYRIA